MKLAKRIMQVDGLRIAYFQIGSGEPLLFLHGGRVRAKTFKPLLLLLAKKYTVIAPDIPGFGSSDTPQAAWSFMDYASLFDAFLEQLKVQDVAVMGYSMGGGVAANLAAISKRVNHLILVDASGIQRPKENQGHHDGRRLCFYVRHPQYAAAFGRLLRDYAQYVWKHTRDHKLLRQSRDLRAATSNEHILSKISMPTLVVWGDNDWIYPVSVGQGFVKLIPHATFVTVPGNHDWPVYSPSLIASMLNANWPEE